MVQGMESRRRVEELGRTSEERGKSKGDWAKWLVGGIEAAIGANEKPDAV
jgi:hypothetical protein